jgi:tetratricopeptide (TPR) repeat protein
VRASNIAFQQGDWKRVQTYYARILRIARRTGDRRRVAMIYMNSGIMASIRGRVEKALELYERSRKAYEELGDQHGLAQTYLNLGWSLAGQNAWERAREAYGEALKASRKTRSIFVEAKCHLNLAEVLLQTGDVRGCKRACLRALEVFEKVDNRLGRADVLKTLGQAASRERNWEDGCSYFERSIAAYEDLQNPLWAGGAHLEYARMLLAEGALDAAGAELEWSVACFEGIDAREELRAAGALRGELEAMKSLAVPDEDPVRA